MRWCANEQCSRLFEPEFDRQVFCTGVCNKRQKHRERKRRMKERSKDLRMRPGQSPAAPITSPNNGDNGGTR